MYRETPKTQEDSLTRGRSRDRAEGYKEVKSRGKIMLHKNILLAKGSNINRMPHYGRLWEDIADQIMTQTQMLLQFL